MFLDKSAISKTVPKEFQYKRQLKKKATYTLQNMYRPIPQSLSDSDSEKELQMDPVHHVKVHRPRSDPPRPRLRPRKPPRKLSIRRKCVLVFSVFLCFITIVVFLWVLPCSGKQVCPIRVPNWKRYLNGLEFRGSVNWVPNRSVFERALVVAFKNSLLSEKIGGGAIALSVNTGDVIWYASREQLPIEINCRLHESANYCLLRKEIDLEAIDCVSGNHLWLMHSHPPVNRSMSDADMPIVFGDLNEDGAKDLLTVVAVNGKHNVFVLISGKAGMVLREYEEKACLDVHIKERGDKDFVYSCKNGSNVAFYQMPNIELKKAFFNSTYTPQTNQSEAVKQKTAYDLNCTILYLNKTGTCPNCISQLNISSKQTNYSQKYERTLILEPKIFTFRKKKLTKILLQGHLSGYILKMWQWSDKLNKRQQIRNMTLQINTIKENIVIITCNDTDIRVINASETNITQLCFPVDNTNELDCQPDVTQHDSLFVADVDEEGSQDIINYSSSFVQNEESEDGWVLLSSMHILHLESELPKLFRIN